MSNKQAKNNDTEQDAVVLPATVIDQSALQQGTQMQGGIAPINPLMGPDAGRNDSVICEYRGLKDHFRIRVVVQTEPMS